MKMVLVGPRELPVSEAGDKVYQARKRLLKILKKAQKKDRDLTDLIRLPGSKKIFKKSSTSETNFCKRYQTWILIATFGFLIGFLDSRNQNVPSGFWVKWDWKSTEDDLCIVSMPEELTRAFRPPVSCSICHGVNEVPKVSNLSQQFFEERYAYTGKPVVIVDGMINWTAPHVFDFDFFKKIYSTRMKNRKSDDCQFFPYETEFKNLDELFKMSEDRVDLAKDSRPWYVGWSNCDDEINRILREHYKKPYFLPDTAETKKLDWIFMGTKGHGAPMHVDNVEYPSWQAQLRGKKKWSLRPPPECYYECVEIEVVVEPGEIIVLDTNLWYHSTLIVSDEISITIGAEYD